MVIDSTSKAHLSALDYSWPWERMKSDIHTRQLRPWNLHLRESVAYTVWDFQPQLYLSMICHERIAAPNSDYTRR